MPGWPAVRGFSDATGSAASQGVASVVALPVTEPVASFLFRSARQIPLLCVCRDVFPGLSSGAPRRADCICSAICLRGVFDSTDCRRRTPADRVRIAYASPHTVFPIPRKVP